MVWTCSFSQGVIEDCGVLWNVLFLPTSSGLGLAAGQTKLCKQFFIYTGRKGLFQSCQSWVLSLINTYHQELEKQTQNLGPKDASARCAAAPCGSWWWGMVIAACPLHPAVFLLKPSFEERKNWACPTRDEEETLNLNPGNVYSFGWLEATSGVRE